MENKYLEEILNNSKYIYYAHTKENGNDKEMLSSHLELTHKYYKKMEKYKNLDEKIERVIKETFNTSKETIEIIYQMYKQAIYYHDIGKINPLFQKNKMKNDLKLEMKRQDDTHAALSARIYIDCIQKQILENKEIKDTKEKNILLYITYYFAYIISRHHAQLEEISGLLNSIKERNIPQIEEGKDILYEKQLAKLKDVIKAINPDAVGLYILCKLLYSCIISADFYATYEYMTENEVPIDVEKDLHLFEKYDNSELIKNIRKYNNGELQVDGIDKLRSDMFIEIEENLLKNIENDIYYIEAPTGSGKTNVAINVAKILYEKNRELKSIQYIFPFNTIIEQTTETFDKYFEKYKDYIVINSVSSMVKDEIETLNYEQAYIKNAFRQYPIIITSHVNLFNTLFGTGKEINYSLYHLVDSIIVLDEIQLYSNNIWKQMIEMFGKYSKLLNIKFVIMSATLPRLDKLLNDNITKFISLVSNKDKYYQDEVFKNRVKLDFSLLERKIDLEELIEEIMKNKGRKILVECIKKDTADKLYKKLKEVEKNVYELTGDYNKYRRNEIIKITKEKQELILIATQTIEAGVDIDMDIGFKDISFLDSEEQFIGRINRSNKKKNCVAYFFNLDDAKKIYRKDNRLEYNLEKLEVREWLENKDFSKFYEKLMQKIHDKTEQYSNENIKNFYNYCSLIEFKKIEKIMNLIDNNMIQLFLNYTIKISNEEICGKDVFDEYKKLYKNDKLSYAEKKVKLSLLAEKMSLFIYTIYQNKTNIIKGEKVGDIYYIEKPYLT